MLESLCVKEKPADQNCTNTGSLTKEDLNNNCLTSHSRSQDSLDEALFKTRKAEKRRQENIQKEKIQIQKEKMDNYVVAKQKINDYSEKSGKADTWLGNKHSKDTQKSRSAFRENIKRDFDGGRFGSDKNSNKYSALNSLKRFAFVPRDKHTETLVDVKDERSPGILQSLKSQHRKRKKTDKERHEEKEESKNKKHLKRNRAKINPKKNRGSDKPTMSFESCLNYDEKVSKRKERCGVKKPSKKIKNEDKEEVTKSFESPGISPNGDSPKRVHVVVRSHLMVCFRP